MPRGSFTPYLMQTFMWATPAAIFSLQSYILLGSTPSVLAEESINWKTPFARPWRVLGPVT